MTEREKIQRALAPLHASDTAVQEVLEMTETKHTHTIRRSGRTILIAAVIAVLLIGTALAVTYSSWSDGLQNRLALTDEEAASLEGTELVSRPAASDTHDGVTISISQAVADERAVYLALRIEGFPLEEGRELAWDGLYVTVDGERPSGWGGGVYDGLRWDGERFLYDDGTPALLTEDGSPVAQFVRPDGSIEFDIYIESFTAKDALLGHEIGITLQRLGTAPISYARSVPEYTAEGPWVLTWTAEGSVSSRTWELRETLCPGVTLTGVTISPLSVHLAYSYPPLTLTDGRAYDADGNELPEEPPALYRIVMRDGTEYTGVLGGGVARPDAGDVSGLSNGFTYNVDNALTRVIEPDEVAALEFHDVSYGDAPDGEEPAVYTVILPD